MAVSGDIVDGHTGGAAGIQWVKAGEAANTIQCTGQPTTENYPAPNINRAKAEKAGLNGVGAVTEALEMLFPLQSSS